MSRLNDTLQDAIYDFITAVTGIQVIWDKPDSQGSQKGEKPPLPYITLNIISGPTKIGGSSETYKELDTFTYSHTFAFTLSIQSFAQNSHLTYLQNILSGTVLPTKLAILQAAGLAIWILGEPVDISALQNTGFEMRGSLDINFAYSVEVDDVPGEIQTVDIDGTLTSASGTEHDVNINKTIVP